MITDAIKKCINASCGLTYAIDNGIYRCSCGSLLDIIYKKSKPKSLIEVFYQRRNHGTNMKVEYGGFEIL
jgi:threonine synthase